VPEDPRTIRADRFLHHPPAAVWRALTDPALLARWLMPGDLRLEVGHTFLFHGMPMPQAGFGGTGHSEVLAFEPGRTLRLAWRAAAADPSELDSTVTFTLEPEGEGTRLFLEHDGFDPGDPYQAAARRIMGDGWPRALGGIGAAIEADPVSRP
jgi:uncharacterized protein YndB with AHSA1/START domain